MTRVRAEEEWVAACLRLALPETDVCQHDDGSAPSMYDFDLAAAGEVFGACEVTAAADPGAIELWNLVNGGGRWIESDLTGGWLAVVGTRCRARDLKRRLPGILRDLENGVEGHERAQVVGELEKLDVRSLTQSGTDFPGSIYVTIERDSELTGGMVSNTGNELVAWFDEWVREPAQEHNLAKLRVPGRAERHLVVVLPGFTNAPFVASDVLMRDDGPVPTATPHLPEPLTHVWLLSAWSTGPVLKYGPDGWSRSAKPGQVAVDTT